MVFYTLISEVKQSRVLKYFVLTFKICILVHRLIFLLKRCNLENNIMVKLGILRINFSRIIIYLTITIILYS